MSLLSLLSTGNRVWPCTPSVIADGSDGDTVGAWSVGARWTGSIQKSPVGVDPVKMFYWEAIGKLDTWYHFYMCPNTHSVSCLDVL